MKKYLFSMSERNPTQLRLRFYTVFDDIERGSFPVLHARRTQHGADRAGCPALPPDQLSYIIPTHPQPEAETSPPRQKRRHR